MAIRIKICGLRDADTARGVAALGADYLGMVLAPSRRQVELREAQRLVAASGLPVSRFVAVFKDPSREDVERVLSVLPGIGVQVHGLVAGLSDVDWVQTVRDRGGLAIVGVNHQTLGVAAATPADILLWDGQEPGAGHAWAWQHPPAGAYREWWLAGGLDPENVFSALSLTRPDGVDVSSGVEQDGRKDLGLVARFIEEVQRWQAPA